MFLKNGNINKHPILKGEKMTVKIHYSQQGSPVSDFGVEKEYIEICKYIHDDVEIDLWFSTENIFSRLRLAIAQSILPCEKIIFVNFDDAEIYINRFGAIPNWPNGFCDYNINIAGKIMRTAFKRKAESKEHQP